jgi:hypothetical protein
LQDFAQLKGEESGLAINAAVSSTGEQQMFPGFAVGTVRFTGTALWASLRVSQDHSFSCSK